MVTCEWGMMKAKDWHNTARILCVRLDTIGDVLMTTPAIRALKESRPNRHITLLTSSAGAKVAPLIPEIDEVIVYDSPWINLTAPRRNSEPELEMVERLASSGFEASVIFTVYSQNPLPAAFLCYLANIPLRLAHCHENPYQLLTNWVPDPEPEQLIRHEVRRQLDLVSTIGSTTKDERLSLCVPEATYDRVLCLLHELGVELDRPLVVIHPGVTALSRRYPPEKYAIVARRLARDQGCQILFTGTGAESDLVAGIQAQIGDRTTTYSLVNRLNLGELAALIALSPLLITNNTGPAHVAAAVGTPVVDLYALTNPQHAPWGPAPSRVLYHDVPCKYCYASICQEGHHHCLELVTPEQVQQAACELLAGGYAGHQAADPLPGFSTTRPVPSSRFVDPLSPKGVKPKEMIG